LKCCHANTLPARTCSPVSLIFRVGWPHRRGQWAAENKITCMQKTGVRGKSFQSACRRREFIIASIPPSRRELPASRRRVRYSCSRWMRRPGCRVGDAMEVSTFRTYPRDVRSVPGYRLACWCAVQVTRNVPPLPGGTDGHLKKLGRTSFRVHVKLGGANRRLLSNGGVLRESCLFPPVSPCSS
jgi:hypothetical protein